tara:strand:+ start:475 stop:672 length:198 start_codon:yes stop_codon:yes gene_type:complete
MSNSMTDIEYDAFIEHLKSSEIYKKETYRIIIPDPEGNISGDYTDKLITRIVKGYFDGKTARFPK